MLKKYTKQLFVIIVLVCIPVFIFTVQVSMSNPTGKQPTAAVAITIQSLPADKAFLTKEKLQSIGREIIEKYFPEDLAKSGQASGAITLVEDRGDNVRFELMGLFLYRATYTAVTHNVLFSVSGDGFVIISIDGK
ncbi:MAG: hypothetical protein C0399_05600 [Syntrophus sp. (in: bacteria)]|nr:hypothetical protein [Syntrophus sp. (in: bacteria)]